MLSLSIVSLSVLCPPSLSLSISPASQTTENPSLFVNWPGSGERIVAKCSAACLSVTFRLFCSAFHQQTKTQPRQIKPSLSQSACLSHRHAVISPPRWSIRREKKSRGDVCVRDYSALFPPRSIKDTILFSAATGSVATKSFTLSAKLQTWPGQTENSIIRSHTETIEREMG